MHPQLGVGMRLTDPETGVRRTTFIREAIGLANGGKRFRRGIARVLRRDDPCQREAHSAFHREKYRYKPAKACGTDHRGGDRAAVHCQQRFRHFGVADALCAAAPERK